MVIRKLFGAVFDSEKLTLKAISKKATRTSQEINDFIQAGIDEKVLDVDGDGSVTALGDGLMVIRKLFGASFDGDKLTSKAMSNDATRTTDEIHKYIQYGIDDKTLDVDGDGSVTALSDGLMIIRKLFRTAFAGDKLTAQAISNDATRTTNEIHKYIAAMSNVDPIA